MVELSSRPNVGSKWAEFGWREFWQLANLLLDSLDVRCYCSCNEGEG